MHMAYDEVLVLMPHDIQPSVAFPEMTRVVDAHPLPIPEKKNIRYVARGRFFA